MRQLWSGSVAESREVGRSCDARGRGGRAGRFPSYQYGVTSVNSNSSAPACRTFPGVSSHT